MTTPHYEWTKDIDKWATDHELGMTFTKISEKYNTPISHIRYYLAPRKVKKTINLSQSLAIFDDILDDISDTVAINLTDKLEKLDKPTCPKVDLGRYLSSTATLQDIGNHIRWRLYELEVEEITKEPLRIIKRIESIKYYKSDAGKQNLDKITSEDIARAKDVPIEELYDGTLRRSGGKQWGISPFRGRENTASFCIHPDNRWSDFGVDNHGDSIDFIQKRDGIDFISAVKSLTR